MINCRDLFDKVVDISGQFQIRDCSPNSLEMSYNIFLSSLEQSLSIYNDYRPANEKYRITAGGWTYTFPNKENNTNFLQYTFHDNPPDVIRSVTPTHLSGLTPPWLYDWWSFNTEKKCFIWQYNKPVLNLMYPGRFDCDVVYYHKIMHHLKDTHLDPSYLPNRANIGVDDSADVVAQKTAYWINRNLPLVFVANAIGNGKLRITCVDVGVVAGPVSQGNTSWDAPVITVLGDLTTAQVIEFTCKPGIHSDQSKYILFSSPDDTYYNWFSIDNADGDPIQDNDFLYYIKKEEDRIFYDIISARFMIALGQTRSNFDITNLEIRNSGAKMVTDGLAREQAAIQALTTQKAKWWLGWK